MRGVLQSIVVWKCEKHEVKYLLRTEEDIQVLASEPFLFGTRYGITGDVFGWCSTSTGRSIVDSVMAMTMTINASVVNRVTQDQLGLI